jgi:hypothetical protein
LLFQNAGQASFAGSAAIMRDPWWERKWLLLLLVLLSAVPLLRPEIPPLLDLPSHIGRYRIQMEYAGSSFFQHYFTMHWLLIGDLGIDLLVVPLSQLTGLEMAVKLILLAVPPLTAAGFLWTAREAHGRIPPTALFALPLAWNFPLHFGFVNFALGMAFAFLMFALWLRLARLERFRLRAMVFVPLSLLLWLTHVYAWAVFGVVAYGAELARHREQDEGIWRALVRAAFDCLCLAPPLLPLVAWRTSDVSAQAVTGGFFNPFDKTNYLITLFRDRWKWFDLASLALIGLVVGTALRRPRRFFAPALGIGAILLAICYLVLPARMFGSSYADLRILPYTMALALLAIRPPELSRRQLSHLAAIAIAFLALRTGGTTASFWLYAQEFEREMPAIEAIPAGSRVVAFIGTPCRGTDWMMRRLDHFPGLAIARRRAFANDQWVSAGGQLADPYYPAAGEYAANPSQIVRITKCPSGNWRTLDESLAAFPRDAFDYVWLIRPPAFDRRLTQGLVPIWTNGDSVLYRIADHHQPGG